MPVISFNNWQTFRPVKVETLKQYVEVSVRNIEVSVDAYEQGTSMPLEPCDNSGMISVPATIADKLNRYP